MKFGRRWDDDVVKDEIHNLIKNVVSITLWVLWYWMLFHIVADHHSSSLKAHVILALDSWSTRAVFCSILSHHPKRYESARHCETACYQTNKVTWLLSYWTCVGHDHLQGVEFAVHSTSFSSPVSWSWSSLDWYTQEDANHLIGNMLVLIN